MTWNRGADREMAHNTNHNNNGEQFSTIQRAPEIVQRDRSKTNWKRSAARRPKKGNGTEASLK